MAAIEYVIPENIDDRLVARTALVLAEGGLVAFPTDTTWSVACSISSAEGIRKLRKLADDGVFMPSVLCSDISQAAGLCELGTTEFRVLRRHVPGPFVFVLPASNAAAKRFGLKRSELGVRIPDAPIPTALVRECGEPLLSLTAKRSMRSDWDGVSEFEEDLLFAAGWELETIEGISLVLDSGEEQERRLSTVVALGKGGVEIIRQGVGILD